MLIYCSIFIITTDIWSLFCLFSVHIVQMLITKMRLVNLKDTYTTMNILPKLPHPMNVFNVEKKIFVYKDYKNILIILEDLFIITNVLSAMNISNLIKNIRWVCSWNVLKCCWKFKWYWSNINAFKIFLLIKYMRLYYIP